MRDWILDIVTAELTPADIERTCSRKWICNYLEHIIVTSWRRQRLQPQLQSGGPNTEENQDVDDQELVIAAEQHIMKNRACRNQVDFLCNDQEYRWNQEREERHKESGDKRLKNFTLVWIPIQVILLEHLLRRANSKDKDKSNQSWKDGWKILNGDQAHKEWYGENPKNRKSPGNWIG